MTKKQEQVDEFGELAKEVVLLEIVAAPLIAIFYFGPKLANIQVVSALIKFLNQPYWQGVTNVIVLEALIALVVVTISIGPRPAGGRI